MTDVGLAEQIGRWIGEDRWLAHRRLFPRRHPEESAPAHHALVADIYSSNPRRSIEGFRGLGKTTLLEEAAILKALFREYHNLVILGASFDRACDRITAIKAEIETNELLYELGVRRGAIWQDGKIVLSNGVCIQALGREQSMMGIKHDIWRPDAALVDDVEAPEERRNEEERLETWLWWQRTFLPSLNDPTETWIRVLGTRRGRGSLPERLEEAGWPVSKYPIEHVDAEGRRAATWPAKFPLDKVDAMKADYAGDMDTWAQEYMCQAVSEQARLFPQVKVEPRIPEWQNVYAMYDPARSTGARSATTGWAVWSWFGRKLIVWDGGAERWLPSEIIDHMFETHKRFGLTWLGVEEDGLNEWLKQPIRQAALERRVFLPLYPVKAPRGKLQFIAGLEPYARAGELVFAQPLPVMQQQMSAFRLAGTRSPIDAPNALAYALTMKPGTPVYAGFGEEHVASDLEVFDGQPLYLAANADGSLVTAALVQRRAGELRVFSDWVREGRPDEVVSDIHAEAVLAAESQTWREELVYDDRQPFKAPVIRRRPHRLPIRWIVPPWHQEVYRNVGLIQAVRNIPQAVSAGEDCRRGRAAIAEALPGPRVRLAVATGAAWTLRAFAGAYAQRLGTRGLAAAEPEAGIYRLLMEGLESFAALGRAIEKRAEDERTLGSQPVAYDRRGMAYKSAMPARARN